MRTIPRGIERNSKTKRRLALPVRDRLRTCALTSAATRLVFKLRRDLRSLKSTSSALSAECSCRSERWFYREHTAPPSGIWPLKALDFLVCMFEDPSRVIRNPVRFISASEALQSRRSTHHMHVAGRPTSKGRQKRIRLKFRHVLTSFDYGKRYAFMHDTCHILLPCGREFLSRPLFPAARIFASVASGGREHLRLLRTALMRSAVLARVRVHFIKQNICL